MPFFEFTQNNSGGWFDFSDNAYSHFVIIEAPSAKVANALALEVGLYFDGAGDCSCCGSRWSSQWPDDKGDEKPSHYGTPISELKRDSLDWSWMAPKPEGFVHYLNGDIDAVYFEDGNAVRVERVKVVQGKQVDKELAA